MTTGLGSASSAPLRDGMDTMLKPPTGSAPPDAAAVLSPSERCDACGAKAYVLTQITGGRFIAWCAHHYAVHDSALRASGSSVRVDLRHRLRERD